VRPRSELARRLPPTSRETSTNVTRRRRRRRDRPVAKLARRDDDGRDAPAPTGRFERRPRYPRPPRLPLCSAHEPRRSPSQRAMHGSYRGLARHRSRARQRRLARKRARRAATARLTHPSLADECTFTSAGQPRLVDRTRARSPPPLAEGLAHVPCIPAGHRAAVRQPLERASLSCATRQRSSPRPLAPSALSSEPRIALYQQNRIAHATPPTRPSESLPGASLRRNASRRTQPKRRRTNRPC